MTDLHALIEKLEAAEGPSRELDALIVCACDLRPDWLLFDSRKLVATKSGSVRAGKGGPGFDAPTFTASIDAAKSLVPPGMTYALCGYSADDGKAIAKVGPRDANASDIPWTRHKDDVFALVIASLKARAKLTETSHG